MRRASSQRAGRSRSWRALFTFFLFLLPVLVAGPALGGLVVWFHAHGPEGDHLHLLTKHVHDDPLAARHAEHDAQGRHEHEQEPAHEHERAPHGLQLEVPQVLAAPGRNTACGTPPELYLPARLPQLRWVLVLGESVRHGLFRSGWPPHWGRRSGLAGLLGSSHAILI